MLDLLTTHVVPEERKLETPIQFAFVHLMHSSWWDALASFNDTAKPILEAATLPRQSPAKRTIANMNTVLCYTLLRVSEWFLPGAVPGIRSSMVLFQLNPDVVTMDTNTMPGIGNHVADVWIKYALEVCPQLLALALPGQGPCRTYGKSYVFRNVISQGR